MSTRGQTERSEVSTGVLIALLDRRQRARLRLLVDEHLATHPDTLEAAASLDPAEPVWEQPQLFPAA